MNEMTQFEPEDKSRSVDVQASRTALEVLQFLDTMQAQDKLGKGVYRPVMERIMRNRDAVKKYSVDSRQQRRARQRAEAKKQ